MDIRELMRKAFNLGETYCHQADSESYSQNKKADETLQKFEELLLAASIDSHQARLQYDALLEALELALAELLEQAQKIENEFGSGEIVDSDSLYNGDRILSAIAAAKGE